MSTDNTGQIPTSPVPPANNYGAPVPPPTPDITSAIPVAPWAPDPTLAGATAVPPTPQQPYQQPGQPGQPGQPWPPQGYPQQPYPPVPQTPSFLQHEAFASFRDVKKTKFGSESFWPNLLRIIGWVSSGLLTLVALITLIASLSNSYLPFATGFTAFLTSIISAALVLTVCMVFANIADDIDTIRKNSDKAVFAATQPTPKAE
ncbi:MAG: hypothetical protein LBC29_06815 [Propionibacteriaceae bacterium]|jgi:hypothetical protein|nr:hypothetical protein [Propionibacteriaceae bacterium]